MIVSFSGPWTSYLCFSEQEKTAARLGLGRFVVKQILQDSHHPARTTSGMPPWTSHFIPQTCIGAAIGS